MIKHDIKKLTKLQLIQSELSKKGVCSSVNTHSEGFSVITIMSEDGRIELVYDQNTSHEALDKMLADVQGM